jgi:hypothetical protein
MSCGTVGSQPLRSAALSPEVNEVREALISALGDDLTAIFWHGSEARAEAKPESDHDLIIVMNHLDDDLLLRIQRVFRGHENWSSYVQTEEELRQYPSAGRLQFHFGVAQLYGHAEPPSYARQDVIDDLRQLALQIRFECRYRLFHKEPDYAEMEPHYRGFLRARNARMLRYAAKLAVLALKARELLRSGTYPETSKQLRTRLTDEDELAIIDIIDLWEELRPKFEENATPLALQLDAFARKLVHELETRVN